MNFFTYVVKIEKAGYLGYFLKMRTSDIRITEIRRSQGLGVWNFRITLGFLSTIVDTTLKMYDPKIFQV
jgi:hypothetical protein